MITQTTATKHKHVHHSRFQKRQFSGRAITHETTHKSIFTVQITDYKTMQTWKSVDWIMVFFALTVTVGGGYTLGYMIHTWL